ncbi:MAG TPA: PQQ-dependent sugar dehydrogenase [Cytophagales bacterium]|nr:PQQ-dependent sugar dehydrogenase [Cytophagales bacterium]
MDNIFNFPLFKKSYPIVKILIVIIFIGIIGITSFSFQNSSKKILVYDAAQNNENDYLDLVKKAASDLKLEVEVVGEIEFFKEESLKNYAGIVCLSAPFESLDYVQQNDLERYVQAGGGLVILAAAADSIVNWPWYNKLVKDWATAKSPVEKEYDGGSFYFANLGTGTTPKSAQKTISKGLKFTAGKADLNYNKATTHKVPESNRFVTEVLDTYLYEPMEFVVFKDGRVLFLERRGAIKMYHPATKKTSVIATFDVSITGNYEDGMLGVALDPDYEQNNWIYIMYSPAGSEAKQNVSRFVLKGDSLVRDSEKIVLEVPTQRETCCHSGGHLEFGPNNNLYISTGDNTSSKESDGFSPIDERPGRAPFDAQKSSGNTHDLRGKILRIHPEPDGTYTIPAGNLFPKDGSKGKPEIYVMGARNPFRFTVDDETGYLYWGDVGPDGGAASERGPQSYDEFNQAKKPGNYGWPYFVADNKAYADFDFETNKIGERFNPERPENHSPNNTGSIILPPAQKPMIWYPYGESKEFPSLGKGSRSAMAGPVYNSDEYPEATRFPEYFDGKLFIYEWARSWVKLVSFDENGDFEKIEPFLPEMEWFKPIDMKFGPDGSLYVLEYGANYFEHNPDSRLIKISYVEGNREPVANITVDKTVGAAPLTINLSAEKSFDYDSEDKLTFSWNLGEASTSEKNENKVNVTYKEPGIYTPSVTVTDKEGKQSTARVEIKVGNEMPQVTIDLKGANQSFYHDFQNLNYKVSVSDKEDGTLGNGIDPESVFISFDYLKEGKDLALLESNKQMTGNVQFLKGKTLIGSSDCKSCHDMSKQSIGPSYIAIAARYKDQDKLDMLSDKILKGGNGNWGKNFMAAHPQHTKQEADEMIKYILSLNDKQNARLPLEGTLAMTAHSTTKTQGSYVLRASYTDSGVPEIGKLTGSSILILRNPKVQAEDFDYSNHVDSRHIDGTDISYITDIEDGSYIGFKNIDLKNIKNILVSGSSIVEGTQIQVRIGAPDGKVAGQATFPKSNRNEEVKTVSISISDEGAAQDLYFVFRNKNTPKENILNVDWMHFSNGKYTPDK